MIELGLTRIRSLLHNRPLPWKAIHVAGTNGKGSICAYIAAMLQAGGVRCGRFTSPHLIDRWDCIHIDGKPIAREVFEAHEAFFKRRNEEEGIRASEFELLTACAFEAFSTSNVQVGVVEVGMGGRLDATNVLEDPLVTVISKIGLDHQAFLGDTIEAIAKEKAGIMKPGVPCVVDGNNEASVTKVIQRVASEVGAGPVLLRKGLPKVRKVDKPGWTYRWGPISRVWNIFTTSMRNERAQRNNISCAYEAIKLALPKLQLPKRIESINLLPAVMNSRMPGRLHTIDVSPLVGRKQEILLDGAHNAESAEALRVKTHHDLREVHVVDQPTVADAPKLVVNENDSNMEGTAITWVLAFTKGKDIQTILRTILKPFDRVFLTMFSSVEGMPWVQPMSSADIRQVISATFPSMTVSDGGDVRQALQAASDHAKGDNVVVAGSLYLVSDVLRLVRSVSGTDPNFQVQLVKKRRDRVSST